MCVCVRAHRDANRALLGGLAELTVINERRHKRQLDALHVHMNHTALGMMDQHILSQPTHTDPTACLTLFRFVQSLVSYDGARTCVVLPQEICSRSPDSLAAEMHLGRVRPAQGEDNGE